MAPTREEAGEKGRLMLLPRRHWLPSAGNNAVLFSPGSCSDQQNGRARLCSAWQQCPILSYRGVGKTPSLLLTYPAPPTPVTLPSLPPLCPSLPSFSPPFSTVQWALTKKLSALSEPASVSDWELSHTPSIRWKQPDVCIEFPGCGRSCPCHTQSCFGFFFYFTPQSPLSSKALNEIIYSVAFPLSSSPRFLTHHTGPSQPPPPPSPSWGRPLVSEQGPRGP